MTNRKNNEAARIETMKKAGVNTANFFNLNMNLPVGADIEIRINDVPYTISNDMIAKQIMDEGYVFNPKTSGRWVTAQTFKLLNGDFYNLETKRYEHGWDAGIRLGYSYMYCFTMMADELHRLAKMEASNDPEFAQVSRFFTKKVVVETCKHYIRQLKKYIKNQPTRKYKGKPYVKLAKYGYVLVKDLDKKVYRKLELALGSIENVNGYKMIEKNFREFMSVMSKLPYETPKCSAWKDAFKGLGGFKSLNNIVKHHGVKVLSYETGELLDRDASVAYIESKLDEFNGEYWKFHELLKATIEANHFDLRQSIELQNRESSN